MPTRRWPPASAPISTGSVVRPIPVADHVAPAASAATAATSAATVPGMPPGTPITRSQWTWPPCGGPSSSSSRCSVATWPRSNSSNSGTTPAAWVRAYSSRMKGQGLANTSSPKLTVPQVSEQASGDGLQHRQAVVEAVGDSAAGGQLDDQVGALTQGLHGVRQTAQVQGRAGAWPSLMWTWMTAPGGAAFHRGAGSARPG